MFLGFLLDCLFCFCLYSIIKFAVAISFQNHFVYLREFNITFFIIPVQYSLNTKTLECKNCV